MKVKTPNNKNIQSYLKPDTVYDAKPSEIAGLFEYTNHLLLNPDGTPSIGLTPLKRCGHLNGQDWIVFDLKNRNRLAHFIKTNNIRTTLVSRCLGYSKGWLTQAMTRTDRGDLDDSELQAIMDKFHIDWASSEYVHVKATKQHTKPSHAAIQPSNIKQDYSNHFGMGSSRMGKKKKAAVKYEWCYCCKDVMPTDSEGRCTVCFSYIILN